MDIIISPSSLQLYRRRLDFVINYDIKYRMGDELNEE